MDFVPQLPRDSDQLKQTLAKAHRNCQEMDMTTNSTTLASLLKTVREASNAIANITLKLEETAGMTLDNQKED